jgi:UDPglucose 6-dehydrogenase
MMRRTGWAANLAQCVGAQAPHEVLSVTVFGAGYVGLVSAACLADLGHYVVCIDTDALRIARLMQGEVPIHEPGLNELLARSMRAGRLRFTTSADEAVAHGRVLFIAVGTPCDEDGSADLQHVLAVARAIGERLGAEALIVDKSTVPVGTADRVRAAVQAALARRGLSVPFHVVSNPEFLKEGSAVADFMHPDRIVVGVDDERAAALMRSLYAPILRRTDQWVQMDVRSAELTKYACNAMLATRLSFMNELALLAERLDADIEQVRRGLGGDPRIGAQFLAPGCGYGGSCLPKDVQALQRSAQSVGLPLRVLAAVEQVNEQQKGLLAQRVIEHFGTSLEGRRIALWGLAFKPGTDDMREAPSATVIRALCARGAEVVAYDPVAMPGAKWRFLDVPGLRFATHATDALDGADALVIVTEWPQFRRIDVHELRQRMRTPLVFDGRNVLDPARLAEQGVVYRGMGRRHRAEPAPAPRAIPFFSPAEAADDVAPVTAVPPTPLPAALHAAGFAGAG